MRDALERLMCERYPVLFRQERGPIGSHIPAAHRDGWFALLDAAAEIITKTLQQARAVQIKQKFGTLRLYIDGLGALNDISVTVVAEDLSGRVCEVTGALGRSVRNIGFVQTLSAEIISEIPDAGPELQDNDEAPGDPGYRPLLEERMQMTLPDAISNLKRRHLGVFDHAAEMSFPPRFYDVIDIAARNFRRPFYPSLKQQIQDLITVDGVAWDDADGIMITINKDSIRNYATKLAAAEIKEGLYTEGAIRSRIEDTTKWLTGEIRAVTDFVAAISRRMDPETGSCGPVDDFGQLIKGH